ANLRRWRTGTTPRTDLNARRRRRSGLHPVLRPTCLHARERVRRLRQAVERELGRLGPGWSELRRPPAERESRRSHRRALAPRTRALRERHDKRRNRPARLAAAL